MFQLDLRGGGAARGLGVGVGGGCCSYSAYSHTQIQKLPPARGELTSPRAVYKDRRPEPFHTQPSNN